MNKEYRRRSLRYKLLFLLMVMALVFTVIMTGVSYIVYTRNMNEESGRIGMGIAQTVASDINVNHLKSWIDGKKTNEYETTREKLVNLIESFHDLKSIRICKMSPNQMNIIYNIKADNLENKEFNSPAPYDDTFINIRDALSRGEYQGTLMQKDSVTALVPIKDSNRNVLCYVVSEISTGESIANRKIFVRTLFVAVGLVALILILIAYIYMSNVLISPINKMESRLRKFAQDNSIGDEIAEAMGKINHHSIDEIVKMRDNFINLINDVSMKQNEVKEFDNSIMKKMKAVADENKDTAEI